MKEELIILRDLVKKITRRQLLCFFLQVAIIISILAIGGVVFWWITYEGWLGKFLDWVDSLGFWGAFIIAVCFVVINQPFMIGYVPLQLASGFLFGWVYGMLTIVSGCMIGGVICFFICRIALKQKVEVWLSSKGPVVTGMVADLTEHSTKIGLIIRLTPIPVGMQHAALALSPMSFVMFLITSLVGMFPEQAMFCYLGTTVRDLADIAAGKVDLGWGEVVIVILGVLAVVVILLFVLYISLRALKRAKQIRQMEMTEVVDDSEGGEVKGEGGNGDVSNVAIELVVISSSGEDQSSGECQNSPKHHPDSAAESVESASSSNSCCNDLVANSKNNECCEVPVEYPESGLGSDNSNSNSNSLHHVQPVEQIGLHLYHQSSAEMDPSASRHSIGE